MAVSSADVLDRFLRENYKDEWSYDAIVATSKEF